MKCWVCLCAYIFLGGSFLRSKAYLSNLDSNTMIYVHCCDLLKQLRNNSLDLVFISFVQKGVTTFTLTPITHKSLLLGKAKLSQTTFSFCKFLILVNTKWPRRIFLLKLNVWLREGIWATWAREDYGYFIIITYHKTYVVNVNGEESWQSW